jgi:hypothetical protein
MSDSPRAVSRNLQLHLCPEWPTMFWLPEGIVTILDRQVSSTREAGHRAFRRDIVGFLVLERAPLGAADIASMIERYRRLVGPVGPGRRPEDRSLMVVLPSPISLRIDVLVERVRKSGMRAYRHDLVGALILADRRLAKEKLERHFLDYRDATAQRAARGGFLLERVLLAEHPMRGPRPSPMKRRK